MRGVPESVVLLHGFAGTRHAWDGVIARLDRERYLPLALDLPGHGELAHATPVTFAGCVESVLARAPASFALCGYSLGGRVALHVALQAPRRVERLVLIACSAGIEDPDERALRAEADARLAHELEREPYGAFLAAWNSQPLFAADPPHVRRLALADQLRNEPRALAAVLRGIGAGAMEPLWGRLGELGMPVTVLAGERDEKYVAVGRRMAALLAHGELRLGPGGHRLQLESPGAVAGALATGPGPGRSPTAR